MIKIIASMPILDTKTHYKASGKNLLMKSDPKEPGNVILRVEGSDEEIIVFGSDLQGCLDACVGRKLSYSPYYSRRRYSVADEDEEEEGKVD